MTPKKRGGSARRISQILFTPCGAPIIHLSDQPGISPATRRRPNRAGRPFNPLFDLAPRRVCPACGVSDAPVVSCSTLSPLPLRAVCSLWHFPSHGIAPCLPSLTDGSSALRSPDFPHPFGRDRSRARNRQNSKIAVEHAPAVRAGHKLHLVLNHLLRGRRHH